MPDPIFISFYTDDAYYQACADRLVASLQRFGLEMDIACIDPVGTWDATVRCKPSFILSKIDHYKRPVVWIDIDTEIVKDPSELRVDGSDFSIFNWVAARETGCDDIFPYLPDTQEIMRCSGGVSRWEYTPATCRLLHAWHVGCVDGPRRLDDPVLGLVHTDGTPVDFAEFCNRSICICNLDDTNLDIAFMRQREAKARWLPKTYNWMTENWGPPPDDCVIVHHNQTARHFEVVAA